MGSDLYMESHTIYKNPFEKLSSLLSLMFDRSLGFMCVSPLFLATTV